MPATTYDLTKANGHPCEQGADFLFKIIYWANAAKTARVDLGGYVVKMQVRKHFTSPDPPILDLASDGASPRITFGADPANGEITVAIPGGVTQLLPAPFYGRYDMELQPPFSAMIRLVEGAFEITPEVTRGGGA